VRTAAIYARKSTEQNGVAEESKSVTRQVEHARAYAAANGLRAMDDGRTSSATSTSLKRPIVRRTTRSTTA
jgi:DNA invertase Pin-like site-specific DNA recombinase